MKPKLNHIDKSAIRELQQVIKEIEAGRLIPISVKAKQYSQKADVGAICFETYRGDTVEITLSAIVQAESE